MDTHQTHTHTHTHTQPQVQQFHERWDSKCLVMKTTIDFRNKNNFDIQLKWFNLFHFAINLSCNNKPYGCTVILDENTADPKTFDLYFYTHYGVSTDTEYLLHQTLEIMTFLTQNCYAVSIHYSQYGLSFLFFFLFALFC